MSWQTIRPQLKTLLDSVDSIQDVSGTPEIKFSGYPSAYVLPSNNESEYETTSENVRVYAFIVRLFDETKAGGVATAMEALEKVVDSVLDVVDQEDLKSAADRTVGVNLPAGYTFLNIFAVPGLWAELPEEELLMVELAIRVRVSRDVT